MRLLALCKRRPQGRDLFTQPYGRFYHLPRLLAEHGHEVHLLLLSYPNEPAVYRREGNLHWHSVSILPLGPWPYLQKVARLAVELEPNWVIGFSDIWYGILAERIARRAGAQSLIDAYDNYESYIPWCKPLHALWRRALSKANVITAAGPQLGEWMQITSGGKQVHIVEMSADPCFHPLPKHACRKKIGLPSNKILLGYSGAIHPNRGIQLLFTIFAQLKKSLDIELVMSGRLAKGVSLPSDVRWLGYRPPEEVPLIVNSLDLMLSINKPSAFGNYSYPAKLYEALACGIPVVATNLPATAWVLRRHPSWLADADDVDDFVIKIREVLSSPSQCQQSQGWETSAMQLDQIISSNQRLRYGLDYSHPDAV